MAPWLWFLTRAANSRIFQNKNVVDIAKQIFSDHGFSDFEFRLQRSYPQYEYKVQYRETDFNFISRLLEHEGIFYFFHHENGKHTAVYGDAPSAFRQGERATVSFVPEPAWEHVHGWHHAYEFRPGKWTLTDYDFKKPQTDLTALARLRPLQEGGVTTAGNASGINDGAVAMIVASRRAGEAAGGEPLARVRASAVAGVPPRIMGIGPVAASKKALARAGLSLSDIDVIEINEAFAAQVLACLRGLELSFDDSRINQNGGAIAVGHPLGASGPRIALTAARQLQRTGGRYALVTMCVGVGQGIAAVLERV